jgi:hypothetical protein
MPVNMPEPEDNKAQRQRIRRLAAGQPVNFSDRDRPVSAVMRRTGYGAHVQDEGVVSRSKHGWVARQRSVDCDHDSSCRDKKKTVSGHARLAERPRAIVLSSTSFAFQREPEEAVPSGHRVR